MYVFPFGLPKRLFHGLLHALGSNANKDLPTSTRCTATSRRWLKPRRRESRLRAAPPTFTSNFSPSPPVFHPVASAHCFGAWSQPHELTLHESRIAETLPEEVLAKMHAPAKSKHPVAEPRDLLAYDAILFGIPTRYGNFPAQWKAFWDKTGGIWAKGEFYGKYVGVFVSTGTPGGGQESTAIASMSTLVHHGMIFVPLGYKNTFPMLANVSEVRGGSPWGAGTFAVSHHLFDTFWQSKALCFNDPPHGC